MENIVSIDKVSVNYGPVTALSDITFNIAQGDFLGIIGPNGGGKTTLLRVLSGLICPSDGSVKLASKSLMGTDIKVGYVPQYAKFDRSFPISVFETVLMGMMSKKKIAFHRYSREEKQMTLEVMSKLGIEELKDRQIGQLSGGQMQKALIARTLLQKPDIMYLDEPTASMDAISRTTIYEILKELNKEITIVVVTHDMSFISSYVKNIACLNNKLYYHGEPVLDAKLVQEAYGCSIDLLAHGVPHRVLREHGGD